MWWRSQSSKSMCTNQVITMAQVFWLRVICLESTHPAQLLDTCPDAVLDGACFVVKPVVLAIANGCGAEGCFYFHRELPTRFVGLNPHTAMVGSVVTTGRS